MRIKVNQVYYSVTLWIRRSGREMGRRVTGGGGGGAQKKIRGGVRKKITAISR